jgi:hypothetical protein
MDQQNIHHEDVLMKMFMYSLEGEARQWYRSLPISSLSSLKDFHAIFHSYCKRIYPVELLLHDCCEQIKSLSTNDWENFSDEIHEGICQKNEAKVGFDSFQDVSCNLSGDHHEDLVAASSCEDQLFIEENFVVNHLEDHTAYSSSLPLDMYQSSPVFDEYDNDIRVLDPEVHDVEQFEQQFHEGIESIIREESELVYDSYNSELELDSDKHISISTCLGGDINKLVCNYHYAYFEETFQHDADYIEHVVSDVEINEDNLLLSNPLDILVSNIVKGFPGQEYNGQFQELSVVPVCNGMCDIRALFQEDSCFIDGAEIIDQQLGLLHRLEFYHSLHDPVAIYMESVFT